MSKPDRQFKRKKRNKAISQGSKLYKEAVRNAETLEKGLKKTYNGLPFRHRLTNAIALACGRWS